MYEDGLKEINNMPVIQSRIFDRPIMVYEIIRTLTLNYIFSNQSPCSISICFLYDRCKK